jgi:hypothetical protein
MQLVVENKVDKAEKNQSTLLLALALYLARESQNKNGNNLQINYNP